MESFYKNYQLTMFISSDNLRSGLIKGCSLFAVSATPGNLWHAGGGAQLVWLT